MNKEFNYDKKNIVCDSIDFYCYYSICVFDGLFKNGLWGDVDGLFLNDGYGRYVWCRYVCIGGESK